MSAQQHYSSLPNIELGPTPVKQVAYFQGRCYLAGTVIPLLSRYGPKYYICNIKTGIAAPMDPLGTVKVEGGHSYVLLPVSSLPSPSKEETKESGGYFGTVKRRSRGAQPVTVAATGSNPFGTWDSGFAVLHQRRTSFQPGSLSISSPLNMTSSANPFASLAGSSGTPTLHTQVEDEKETPLTLKKTSILSSVAAAEVAGKESDTDSLDELLNHGKGKPKAQMSLMDFLNSEPPGTQREDAGTLQASGGSPSLKSSPSKESKFFSWSLSRKSGDKKNRVSGISTKVPEEGSISLSSPTSLVIPGPTSPSSNGNISSSHSVTSNLDKVDAKSVGDSMSICSTKKRGSLANVLFEGGSGSLLQNTSNSGALSNAIEEGEDQGSVLGTSFASSYATGGGYLRRTSGTLRSKVSGLMKWKVANSEPNLLDSSLPESPISCPEESLVGTSPLGGLEHAHALQSGDDKKVESQPNLTTTSSAQCGLGSTPLSQKSAPKPVVRTTNVLNKLFTVTGGVASANTLPEMDSFQVLANYLGQPVRAVVVHYKLRIHKVNLSSPNDASASDATQSLTGILPKVAIGSSSSMSDSTEAVFEGLLEDAIACPTATIADGTSATVVGKFGSIQLDNMPHKEAQILMATVNTCAFTIMMALGYNGLHCPAHLPSDNVITQQFKEHQWLQSHLQRVIAFYMASIPVSAKYSSLASPQSKRGNSESSSNAQLPSPCSPSTNASPLYALSKDADLTKSQYAAMPSKTSSFSASTANRPAPTIPSPSPASLHVTSVASSKSSIINQSLSKSPRSTLAAAEKRPDSITSLENGASASINSVNRKPAEVAETSADSQDKQVNSLDRPCQILEGSETSLNLTSVLGSKLSLDGNVTRSNTYLDTDERGASLDQQQGTLMVAPDVAKSTSLQNETMVSPDKTESTLSSLSVNGKVSTLSSDEMSGNSKMEVAAASAQNFLKAEKFAFVKPSIIQESMLISTGEWPYMANLANVEPFATTWSSSNSSLVKQAWTLEEIVAYVLDYNLPFDAEFAEILVQTYVHFTNFDQLFKLVTSYGVANWNGFGRVRVCNFLRLWLEQGWSDFLVSEERLCDVQMLLRSLRSLIVKEAQEIAGAWNYMDSGSGEACRLLNWMEDMLRFFVQTIDAHIPTVISQSGSLGKVSKVDFLTLDPTTIAAQLTFWDHLYFLSIKPHDLLLQVWSDTRSPECAKKLGNLNALVDRFNQISYWVATEVCTQPVLKNRIKVVETLIRTVKHLLRLNNYNAATALISGLNLSAVARLRQTWSNVDSKYLNYLRDYETLLGPAGNYKQYRSVFEEKVKELNDQYGGSPTHEERWQAMLSAQGLYSSNMIPLQHRTLVPQYATTAAQLKLRSFWTTPACFIAYPGPEQTKLAGSSHGSGGSVLAGNGSPVSPQQASTASIPFMPFIGLLLKDLLFVNDGNAKYTSNSTTEKQLVNITKLKMIHQHVHAFTLCQHAVRVAAFHGVSGWGSIETIYSDNFAATLGILPATGCNDGVEVNLNSSADHMKSPVSNAASPVLPTLSATSTSISVSPEGAEYGKTPEEVVREYLRCPRGLNETQLYKYSVLAEKKVGDESLDLRSKWMQKGK